MSPMPAVATAPFKRECIADLKFFKGMHRFLPTLFKIRSFTVGEVAIGHNPRTRENPITGVWNRLFRLVLRPARRALDEKRMFQYKVAETIN